MNQQHDHGIGSHLTLTSEFEAAGLSLDDVLDSTADVAQGRLDTWNRSTGRPFNYMYVNFNNVNAIRYLANWEVTGMAQMFNPNGNMPFSLSLDTDARQLRLIINSWTWTIPIVGGSIEVHNSQPSRELIVKFMEHTYMDGGGWYVSKGSLLYVKDADGAIT